MCSIKFQGNRVILKIAAVHSSEMFIPIYKAKWHLILIFVVTAWRNSSLTC